MIVTHSSTLDISIIKQTIKQLLENPVDPSATVPDHIAYVHTLTTTICHLIEEKDKDMEQFVVSSWKYFMSLMNGKNVEISTEIAPLLAMFMTSLKPCISGWSNETVKELLKQSKSLLMKTPKEQISTSCLMISAVIQTCGPSNPEQLFDMVQGIKQIYKRSQG